MAAQGYPANPRKGDALTISPSLETDDRWLIHAGTASQDGSIVTSGGRVAAVVARANNLQDARSAAYEGAVLVEFDGSQTRSDIGAPKEGTL